MLAYGTKSGKIVLAALPEAPTPNTIWLTDTSHGSIGFLSTLSQTRSVHGDLEDARLEICSLQVDADKLVSVGRNGELCVALLRSQRQLSEARNAEAAADFSGLTDQQALPQSFGGDAHALEPGALACPAASVREALQRPPFRALPDEEGTQADSCSSCGSDRAGDISALPLRQQRVRFYASTVCYSKGVLVNDGLDDCVSVLFIAPRYE